MTDGRRATPPGGHPRFQDEDWTLVDLPTLARLLSLVAVGLGLCGPSCLATSEIDFPPVQQTPPHLRANLVLPPLDRMIVIDGTSTQKVEFRGVVESEDANNTLEARLVADDIFAQPSNVLARTIIEPGRAGQDRSFVLSYDPSSVSLTGQPLIPGCHPVTLVIAPSYGFQSNQPSDPTLQDVLVWWVLKGDPDPKNATFLDGLRATECRNQRGGAVSQ